MEEGPVEEELEEGPEEELEEEEELEVKNGIKSLAPILFKN
jgi:hypothetical protein